VLAVALTPALTPLMAVFWASSGPAHYHGTAATEKNGLK